MDDFCLLEDTARTYTTRANNSVIDVRLVLQSWPSDIKDASILCGTTITTSDFVQIWLGDSQGTISIWNENGQFIRRFETHSKKRVYGLITTPNNKIWSSGEDCKLLIYDPMNQPNTAIQELIQHQFIVRTLYCSENLVYSGDLSGIICIWDATTSNFKCKVKLSEPIRCMTVADDNLWIGGQLKIFILNKFNGESVKEFTAHSKRINCIINLGSEVWSGADDGFICIWKLNEIMLHNGNKPIEALRRIDVGDKIVSLLCVADNYVVSGSYAELIVWNSTTLSSIYTFLNVHRDVIHCLIEVRKDIFWSGSSSKDGSFSVWRTSTDRNNYPLLAGNNSRRVSHSFIKNSNLTHSQGKKYSEFFLQENQSLIEFNTGLKEKNKV